MLVNLINIAYCAMKLLPYQDESFSKYQNESTQEIRFAFSERIRQEVFFANLAKIPKEAKINMDYGFRKTVVSETVCINLKVVKWCFYIVDSQIRL